MPLGGQYIDRQTYMEPSCSILPIAFLWSPRFPRILPSPTLPAGDPPWLPPLIGPSGSLGRCSAVVLCVRLLPGAATVVRTCSLLFRVFDRKVYPDWRADEQRVQSQSHRSKTLHAGLHKWTLVWLDEEFQVEKHNLSKLSFNINRLCCHPDSHGFSVRHCLLVLFPLWKSGVHFFPAIVKSHIDMPQGGFWSLCWNWTYESYSFVYFLILCCGLFFIFIL